MLITKEDFTKMTDRRKIVITRPYNQSVSFMREFDTLHGDFKRNDLLIAPMLKIVSIPFRIPKPEHYTGLVITSQNALPSFLENINKSTKEKFYDMPIYATGEYTAETAGRYGFRNVVMTEETAYNLAERLKDAAPSGKPKLLYLKGKDVTFDFERYLGNDKYDLKTLTVYEAQKMPQFPDDLIANMRQNKILGVTFFSTRTAENFVALAEKHKMMNYLRDIKALCISTAVLKYVQPYFREETYTAKTRDREGMINLVKAQILVK